MKTEKSITTICLVIPIILIVLQLLFLFMHLLTSEITFFGWQDAEFTEEKIANFYFYITPLWIVGGLFVLSCVFFIVYGFLSRKEISKKTNIVFLALVSVLSIYAFVAPIIQTVYLFKIGIFVERPDALATSGFYVFFGPAIISSALVIPLSIVCIRKAIIKLGSENKQI